MRVVSWNVWWRFGGNWRSREQGIVATLVALEADIVGLQGVWGTGQTTQADVVADRLGMYASFGSPSLPPPPEPPESPDQAGVDVGVAVLSRWPIGEVVRHRLPARHRYDPPIALEATVTHPAGPLHVVVTCLEWEPEFADDQLAQAGALARLLADPALDGPLPVLLTGDLNAAPDTPAIRALTGVVTDTWVAGGGRADAVTLSSTVPFAPLKAHAQIDHRIDYVMARPGTAGGGVDVERVFLADAPVNGLYPSDHYATVADLAT